MDYYSYLLMMLVLTATLGWAQPNGTGSYYQSADGHKGKSLKTALYEIIKSPSVKSYSELFECYKITDLRPNGKIWDMYSNSTNYDPDNDHSGNYTAEGDMFNREHSFPKNWFGNIAPMNSDLFHVIPTDGYVNNRRSNYPFGETNGNAEIRNNKYTTRSIRYNSSSPRFACYTTGQEPVSLYKRNVSSSIDIVDADRLWSNKAIYSIDGRRIGTVSNVSDPTEGLPCGVYIIGGKKLIVFKKK